MALLLEKIQGRRTAEERLIVSKGLAGMAEELSAEEARSVIAALADATAKSDHHDAAKIQFCLSSALEARPPEELVTHVPAVFAAASQCKSGSERDMARVMKELIRKTPPEQAASHAESLIDLLAQGAVGGGTRLNSFSQCLSSLLPRVPVEQRAALATKAASVVARLHQDYVGQVKPNTIQRDLHHVWAVARIAKPFGEISKDVPPTAAKQFATTMLAFAKRPREPGFHFEVLARALPEVVDNLPLTDAPAVNAQILKMMGRAGAGAPADLREYDPDITGPLCAALFRVPGKLNEATAKRVTDVMVGSIGATGLMRIPRLTGAMEVAGDELTDSQLLEIVRANLRKIERMHRSRDAYVMVPLLTASLRPLSPDGAKQAWPLIIASMDLMEGRYGLTAAGQGLWVATSKLPAEMASEAIEVIKTSKNRQIVRGVQSGLWELAAAHSEVRTLLDKELASIQDPEKRRFLDSVAQGSPVLHTPLGDSPKAILPQLDTATNPAVLARMLRRLDRPPEGLDPPQIVALLKYPTMVGPAEEVLIQQLKRQADEPDAEKAIEGLWDFATRAEEFSLAEEVRRAPAKLSAE